MSSRLEPLRCSIIGSNSLTDRLLATGSLYHSIQVDQPAVLLTYNFEVTKPWFAESKLLPTLIDTLNTEYPLLVGGKDLEEQFEILLKHLNQTLNQISESGETDWIGNFNGLVACISDDQLQFSQSGRYPAYLLQRNRIRQITDDPTEERDIHPLKTFANVASGLLKADDRIVIANQELYREISLDALRRLLTNSTPFVTCQQICKDLKHSKNSAVSATILHVQSSPIPTTEPTTILLDEIFEHPVKKLHRTVQPHLDTAGALVVKGVKASARLTVETILPQSTLLAKKGISLVKKLRPAPQDPPIIEIIAPGRQESSIDPSQLMTTLWQEVKKRRIPALAIAVAIIVLTIFLITLRFHGHNSAQATATSSPLFSNAKTLVDETGSEISQKQLTEAAATAQKAQTALLAIAGTSSAKTTLWSQLVAQEDVLTQTTRLTNPTNYPLAQSGSAMLYTQPFLYVISSQSGNLLVLRQNTTTVNQISLPIAQDTIVALAPSSDPSIAGFVLTKLGHVYEIIQSNSSTTLQSVLPVSGSFASGSILASYNQNLYVLDATNGLLWRYANTGTSYAAGTNNINPQLYNLKQSVSLAIDGSIYLLQQDGSLQKFTAGTRDNTFALQNIPSLSEPLTRPLQVITDANNPNIYILDAGMAGSDHPTAKLIEVTKSGNFIQEYAFPNSDTDVNAVDVDIQDKLIWLLNGQSLQEFVLP